MAKKLRLSQGATTIVDDDVYELVKDFTWWLNGDGYAISKVGGRKNPTTLFLHRLINNTPPGKITDHINQNRLDNRKSNLRTTDKSGNALNARKHKDNKSGYKGVHWNNGKSRWQALIYIKGKSYLLKRSRNINECVNARLLAEKRYNNGQFEKYYG